MNGHLNPVNGSVRSVHTYLNMQVLQMNCYLLSVKVALKGISSIQTAERHQCPDMSGCPGFVFLGSGNCPAFHLTLLGRLFICWWNNVSTLSSLYQICQERAGMDLVHLTSYKAKILRTLRKSRNRG